MIPAPPADRNLPGLATLLDENAMIRLLADVLPAGNGSVLTGYRPRYIRYKPGTSCLVQVDLAVRDDVGAERTVAAHLKLVVGDRALRRLATERMQLMQERSRGAVPALADFGWPLAAHLPDLNALLQFYPVDYDLKFLARAADPVWMANAFHRALGDDGIGVVGHPTLVRYKPERKALFRYELNHGPHERLYGKLYTDDRGTSLVRTTRALIEAGVHTPAIVVDLPKRRFVAHAEVPGLPLAALRETPGYTGWMSPLAVSLDHLQRVDVPGLAAHRLADRHARLVETASLLSVVAPQLAGQVDSVMRGISLRLGEIDDQLQTAHGDFYDDQAIVSSAGLTLIDFDELRLAHPALDAGNMLAHLASGHARGEAVDGARSAFRDEVLARHPDWSGTLDVFDAAALLELATGPFRRLEPDWPEGIARIVALAEACLDRGRRHPAPIHDPLLPHLPQVLEPATVAGHLTAATGQPVTIDRAELVRHKAGRRAIVRYDLGDGASLYGKTFASERGPKVHRIAKQITGAHAFGPGVALPEPVVWVPELKLLVQRAVAGGPVERALRCGDTGLARCIAEALYRFHASGLDLGRSHDLLKELAPLSMRTENVASTCPDLADRARALHEHLLAFAGRPFQWRTCPIHRDFYHDQVLIDGGRLAVLDLDDAAMSEPAVDIANFAAHLRLLGFQQPDDTGPLACVEAAFVNHCRRLDPALESSLMSFLMASTMLRLAGIHGSRANGRQVAGQLLKAAECELDMIPSCPIGDVSHSTTVRQ